MTFRRKRLVRLHLQDGAPSIEGFLLGQAAGHYQLAAPKLLEAQERTLELAGEAWVPRERVLYVQVLG